MCGGKLDNWDKLNYTTWQVMGNELSFYEFSPYEQFQGNEF
jgi:hypothetical protein